MDIIEQALAFVKEFFSKEFSGHDYFHTLRVYKMATHIALKEGADLQTVQLAALLHDVDDRKLSPQTHATKANARSFLRDHRVTEDTVEILCRIIEEISFGADAAPSTLESQCVQDADRLDAIGAVGIARAFAFGGNHNRLMHHPDIPPKLNMTKEEYRNHNSTTVNHFHEKLFLLKDLMNTATAKQLAEKRHHYMVKFIEEFLTEWEGLR